MTSSTAPPDRPTRPAEPAFTGPGLSSRSRRGESRRTPGYREPLNADEPTENSRKEPRS